MTFTVPDKGFTHGGKFHADDVFSAALLRLLAQLAPEATCTLELMQDRPSLRWLEEQELLE